MADDHYEIDGKKDASEYYWTGAQGERKAYSKAYADARAKEGDDTDYMKKVGEGALKYDQARMKDQGDYQTVKATSPQSYAPEKKAIKHKVPSYKKGGIVRKTGLALVHKGEKVIPKHKVERKRG